MKRQLRQLIRRARDFVLSIDCGKSDAERVAHKKRQLERELRAKGYGRQAAIAEASKRFRSR